LHFSAAPSTSFILPVFLTVLPGSMGPVCLFPVSPTDYLLLNSLFPFLTLLAFVPIFLFHKLTIQLMTKFECCCYKPSKRSTLASLLLANLKRDSAVRADDVKAKEAKENKEPPEQKEASSSSARKQPTKLGALLIAKLREKKEADSKENSQIGKETAESKLGKETADNGTEAKDRRSSLILHKRSESHEKKLVDGSIINNSDKKLAPLADSSASSSSSSSASRAVKVVPPPNSATLAFPILPSPTKKNAKTTPLCSKECLDTSHLKRAILAFALFSYLQLINAGISYFDCVIINGLHVLRQYPAVSCDSSSYRSLLPYFAATLLLMSLVPLIVLGVTLYKYCKKNNVVTPIAVPPTTASTTATGPAGTPSRAFLYFMEPWRPRRFFWDFVVRFDFYFFRFLS
jgi:hypothetical protein